MRRFRMSTLMLLIVIAALGIALVVQQQRSARREAEFRVTLRRALLLTPSPRSEDIWQSFLKQHREHEELAKRELANESTVSAREREDEH
jgi:hypothetical protein